LLAALAQGTPGREGLPVLVGTLYGGCDLSSRDLNPEFGGIEDLGQAVPTPVLFEDELGLIPGASGKVGLLGQHEGSGAAVPSANTEHVRHARLVEPKVVLAWRENRFPDLEREGYVGAQYL
jgi:hypothetical protein